MAAGGAQKKLFDAVFMSNVRGVKSALKNGASVKRADGDGYHPLFLATQPIWPPDETEKMEKAAEILRILIAAGADLNQSPKGFSGYTPMMSAATGGNAKLVSVLIEAGAEVDRRDDHGYTALHRAALNGRAEVVKLLLNKGADKSLKTSSRETPLQLAREGMKEDSGQTGADFKKTLKLLEAK